MRKTIKKNAFTKEEWTSFLKKAELPALMTLGLVFAFLLRFSLFDGVTGDYNSFLSKWVEQIRELGVVKAWGSQIGDYTPAYFYILTVLAYLPVHSLYSIKFVSCIFDVVLAYYVFLCIKELTGNKNCAFLAYGLTLFLPTVFLNSGAWAQCDSIFTAFCVMCLYYLLKGKNITAVILYGVAFSFKLQAIFFAPLLAVLWFKQKIPLWSPLAILGVYFVFCIPCWICGRSLLSLLTIYFSQTQEYPKVVLNAPTLGALFGNPSQGHHPRLISALVYLALFATLALIYFAFKISEWKREYLVDFGMLFVLGIPFLLPCIHERYFYLADIMAIVYVFMRPKRSYTLILTEFCSFYVVCNYLFSMNYLSLGFVALLQFINLTLLVKNVVKDCGVDKLFANNK